MIEYSCHSENFGILSADETFHFISKLGFSHIDVAARSLIPQEKMIACPHETAQSLIHLCQTHHLKLSELFLSAIEVDGIPCSPSSVEAVDHPTLFHNFEVICQFAKEAGFQSIMGAAGCEQAELGFMKSFEQAASVLLRQVNIAKRYGLAFHVEPSRLSLLNTPQRALEMAAAVPGLAYTLDFLHYHIQGIPQEETMKLLPYAGHLHARQAQRELGKCDFYSGEIDYNAIVKYLVGTNWRGIIAMEFWCSEGLLAQSINSVEQNILMRSCLKRLVSKWTSIQKGGLL